jgi:3-hydroxyisobutyrate dehydrogenase-like beta-hydroxyacid dehydrogenase
MTNLIGFIGMGEAAGAIAEGLATAGAPSIAAFDAALADPVRGKAIRARAEKGRVTLAPSLAELVHGSEIVIASVTASVALDVAKAAAPHLRAGQLYMDTNSASPDTKRAIGAVIEEAGGRFVEAAVMQAVPPSKHKVPMLLCGAAAPDVIARLAPYGMVMEYLGPELGQASATKMFRSIILKGLEALFLESVMAASRYGVADKVMASIEEGYPGISWKGLATYLIGRTAIHGERRAHEMDEVGETLAAMGLEPIMSEAAARRIRQASAGLPERFAGKAPDTYDAVMAAIRDRDATKAAE